MAKESSALETNFKDHTQHIHHPVLDKEQMQNEEFSRTLGQQVKDSHSMIAALTADYLNVYVVEPEINQGSVLKLDGYEVAGINEQPKNFLILRYWSDMPMTVYVMRIERHFYNLYCLRL